MFALLCSRDAGMSDINDTHTQECMVQHKFQRKCKTALVVARLNSIELVAVCSDGVIKINFSISRDCCKVVFCLNYLENRQKSFCSSKSTKFSISMLQWIALATLSERAFESIDERKKSWWKVLQNVKQSWTEKINYIKASQLLAIYINLI